MSWPYVLCDLSGTAIGELRAFSRAFTPAISQPAQASAVIRQDDPLWSRVAAGQSKLKVYNSVGDLVLYGPLISDEEVADASSGPGVTVKITAADQIWELSKRYFAADSTGVGLSYEFVEAGVIAFDILDRCNDDYPTGITAGETGGHFVSRTVTYLWKNALQAIGELGAIEGSYEWTTRYVDGSPPIVYLDLSPELGDDRTGEVALDYGTGQNNVQTYDKLRSIDQQATTVWALGSGSTLVAESQDTAAENFYKARREDVVTYGDITVEELLAALAAENLALRKDPYQIVQLGWRTAGAKYSSVDGEPLSSQITPRYGVDYFLGDWLSAHVVVNGLVRVNGAVRVWGAQINIDELGNEAATLTLVPQQGVV